MNLRACQIALAVLCVLSVARVDAQAQERSALKIELGRRLFYDADLSINGTMACATCHEARRGFTDGNATHPGATDQPGRRNVPGLANVAAFHNLTWANNQLAGLEQQAMVPLTGTDPVEMGMGGQEPELMRRLSANPCYAKLFAVVFPDRPADGLRFGFAEVTSAIASFERTFISFRAEYDKAAASGTDLADGEAQAGKTLFFAEAGCSACHGAPLFSDDQFHRVENAPSERGLAALSGLAEDTGLFRTPSLRNASLTAPYWHDGSAKTPEAAIRRHQQPGAFAGDDRQIRQLVAFIGSLTDPDFARDPQFAQPDLNHCPVEP